MSWLNISFGYSFGNLVWLCFWVPALLHFCFCFRCLAFDLISGIDNVTGILENPELWASSCSNLWLLEYWLAKQRSKLASLSLVKFLPVNYCKPDLFAAFTFWCLFRLPCGFVSWIFEVDVGNFRSDLDCFGMMLLYWKLAIRVRR